ncbi:unnamed protein product [Porites lobata]|uniref:Uncharacterized protein n=1 Tax=Porites lobata TaxID=104759 RepID=A0ABN8PW99_9CNID|nr:unnamed protein product [Porites lobata]
MNRLVKADEDAKLAKKPDGLPPSIERIRGEVKRQQDEQFLAVIGRGEYRLTEDFSFLGIDEKGFYRMKGALKEFLKWFKSRKRSPNLSGLANVNMPNNAGQKPEQGSGKVEAINPQLIGTLFAIGYCSLHPHPSMIHAHLQLTKTPHLGRQCRLCLTFSWVTVSTCLGLH